MPKLSSRQTNTSIKNLKPKEKVYFVSDGDNLLIEIRPTGAKTFMFEYKSPKTSKRRRISIGQYPNISLSEARSKKDDLKNQISNGIDVLDAKTLSQNFRSIYDEWINLKQTSISKSREKWIKSKFENVILPKFGMMDIKDITKKDILSIIHPYIMQKYIETADKILTILNIFWKYATMNEYTNHNIIADIDKKALFGKREEKHYPFLKNDHEISMLLKNIKEYFGDERIKICALLQLYTAVRGGNARFAEVDEFDFKSGLWKISGKKMKTGIPHEVFLSEKVKYFLKNYMEKYNIKDGYLFPSLKSKSQPISENTVRVMLRNIGYSKEMLTPHGFRATFSTIGHEKRDEHGCSSDIIELCLAHVEQNKIKDAYNHAKNLKARAKLMQWWSDYLDSLDDAVL